MERPADILFPERRHHRTEKTCIDCGKPATEFRNELSRREYDISLLCQDCQDEVFGPSLADEWMDEDD